MNTEAALCARPPPGSLSGGRASSPARLLPSADALGRAAAGRLCRARGSAVVEGGSSSQTCCSAAACGHGRLGSICTCRTNPEEIEAYVGTTALNGTDGNAVKVNVTRVTQHPLFNPVLLDFDVAVLELARPLVFNKYIQPVCLPAAGQKFPVGKKCVVSGWGSLQEGNGTR